jgi:hypothetical protein
VLFNTAAVVGGGAGRSLDLTASDWVRSVAVSRSTDGYRPIAVLRRTSPNDRYAAVAVVEPPEVARPGSVKSGLTDVRAWTDSFDSGADFDSITAAWRKNPGDSKLVAENDDRPRTAPGQPYYDCGLVCAALEAGECSWD